MEFANCKFDGRLGYYIPDSNLDIKDYKTFISKKEAAVFARSAGIPLTNLAQLGTRFCRVWGFRRDFQTNLFLTN